MSISQQATARLSLGNLSVTFLLVLLGWCFLTFPVRAEKRLTYEQQVRPILKTHCFSCHGEAGQREGGLDLRLRRLLLKGGESGPAIVPGDRMASELFVRVEGGVMPPGDLKLKAEEIEQIGRWIDADAPTARPEPEEIDVGYLFTREERTYWAFRPVEPIAVPTVSSQDQVRTPIDAFLLARLEPVGLSFAPEAEKSVLLRRACFDLLGLPPTPEQVRQFLADEADNAYARLLDRLLASPQYGERWGRHWLDAAGYADSEGYTAEDPLRPDAYKYRDYVIRSINADKRLHQQIMLSAAYRQSSVSNHPMAGLTVDGENRLFWHMPMQRLEAEAIRDAILLVSGKLNADMFGKPVPVREDEVGQVVVGIDTTDSAGRPTGKVVSLDGQEFRRSLYVTVRRSQPLAVLDTFDAPIMAPNCDQRTPSTVTPQALLLLNSQFIRTMAGHFARRVEREAGADPNAGARHARQLAYGQLPTEAQVRDAAGFLDELASQYRVSSAAKVAPAGEEAEKEPKKTTDPGEPMLRALKSYCQALLSSNRFLYVE
jgi:mono/diheme cytochrome c family protein